MAESLIDTLARLGDGLSARQRHALSKLLQQSKNVRVAKEALDAATAERDSQVLTSVDDFGLDVRSIVAPATGLTHTRINQILATKG